MYDDDFHIPCYGTIEEQRKAYQVACNLEQDEDTIHVVEAKTRCDICSSLVGHDYEHGPICYVSGKYKEIPDTLNPFDSRLRVPLNEHRKRFGLRIPGPPAGCRLTEEEERLRNEGVKGFIDNNVKSCRNKKKTIKSNKLFNLYKKSQYFQGDDMNKFIIDVIALGFSVQKNKNKTLFTGMEMKQNHNKMETTTDINSQYDGITDFIKNKIEVCDCINIMSVSDLYVLYKKSKYYKGELEKTFFDTLNVMNFHIFRVKVSKNKSKRFVAGIRERKNVLDIDDWPSLLLNT
jgi:hypothetical protein